MPVIAELSSNFSAGQRWPDESAEVVRGDLVHGLRSGLLLAGGPEYRQPDSSARDLLELDLNGLAEFELVGIAFNDVGGQPDSRVLDNGDLGHDVGRRQIGEAEPVVDGEGGQRGPAGDVADAHVAAAAVPAHRLRRMDQCLTVPALLDAQHAVAACGPEELVLDREFRQRSRHRTNPEIASLSSVFGSGSGVSCAS